jgi:ribonucleoside-diphosphate reductase alpha chain
MYEFKHKDLRFSRGGLDELLAYDRYVVSTNDPEQMNVGDIVVALIDQKKDIRKVAEVVHKDGRMFTVVDREGAEYTVDADQLSKPLEHTPQQLWARWAKGAASVEKPEKRVEVENRFRKFLDGYGHSPGGRIQLMLGQELVTGKKANLTGYNCFVLHSPRKGLTSLEQWKNVMAAVLEESLVMRTGGGVGFNLSDIATIEGAKSFDIRFYLTPTHSDYEELQDRKSLGYFDGVEFGTLDQGKVHTVPDSIVGLINSALYMIEHAYTNPQDTLIMDFSKLRHRNAPVRGIVNGRSSGAASWMELYALIVQLLRQDTIDAVDFAEIFSKITLLIIQGGSRRGALMEIMNVSRRDIIRKFITRKRTPGKLTGANISVGIDEEDFMEKAFQKGTEESEIYNLIVESAWASAEPGVVFLKRCNDESNSWYFNPLVATNPCLHKDTYMVTENGLEKISNLRSRIWNTREYVESRAWKTGVKKVVRLMTNSGFEYIVTPDHKFMLADGKWVPAIETIGQNIAFDVSEKEWIGYDPYNGEIDYKILGFILGDGGWHAKSNRMNLLYITPGADEDVEQYIASVTGWEFDWVNGKYVCKIPYGTPYANVFKGHIADRLIPDWIMQLPKREMADFLCGLFSANGTNLHKYDRIQLVSINKDMLQQVQQMLLLFGIKAKLWYHNKEHDIEFSNGVYTCKKSYHLVISRKSYERFLDKIGFIQEYKNGYTLKQRKEEKDYETVVLISEMDEEEVWDFSEPTLHRGVTNGAVVHNCGEQPLPEYGVCNLGHLVLPHYAVGDRIGQYKIDWKRLEFAARTAVRFQDNVIDYTDYFLPENREVQLSERRIGIGTMGLGTLLILLGLRYGSDEAIEFIDELYSKIAYWIYDESINLAVEKGAFKKFEYDKFIQSGFMRRLLERFPQLQPKLKKHGIRNVTLITQAPTGSTGTLLDNIPSLNMSTGIEPYFSWKYYRASRGGGVTEQEVELVKTYREQNGLSADDPLPDFFVTAMELKPEEHVRVQAAIQKWVDSAISKTANVPSDYTVEDTDKLYRLAYELGLKGVTIYRSGSREAQVLATDKEDAKLESHIEAEKIEQQKAKTVDEPKIFEVDPSECEQLKPIITKRPSRLFGFTEKVRIPLGSDGRMGKVYITINVDPDTGLPIEVFVNANDPELRSTGAALGRMTTQFLRFGCTRDNVEQAVKHLRKGEHMGTLPYTIASLLERVAYGKIEFSGVVKKRDIKLQPCPKCNELTYDKGSCVCHTCGYSSCN